MGVARIDRHVARLEHDREVGWLLDLEDEDAGTDRMRRPGRDEPDVARLRGTVMERPDQLIAALLDDPAPELVAFHRPAETQPDARWRLARDVARAQDDPRLGLAERRPEMLAGERARRVGVDGQPDAGVQELHEDARRRVPGLIAADRIEAADLIRVGLEDVANQPDGAIELGVTEAFLGHGSAGRRPGARRRAEPVLGPVGVPRIRV